MKNTCALYLLGSGAIATAIAFPVISWISPLTFMIAIPLLAAWMWKGEGRSLWDPGYRLARGWSSRLAVGMLFGLVIPALFRTTLSLAGWVALAPRGEPATQFVFYLGGVLLKMLLIVGIEEWVFRGILLNALKQKAGMVPAVVLSSLLWGASHLPSMVKEGLSPELLIIAVLTFMVWGITLGIGFIRTGNSLWLPFGLHFGVNVGFSMLGWFFISRPNAPQWLIGHPSWSPESGVIGIVVWLLCAALLYGLTGRKGNVGEDGSTEE